MGDLYCDLSSLVLLAVLVVWSDWLRVLATAASPSPLGLAEFLSGHDLTW